MKYLHKFELFLENLSTRKYEVVIFNKDYIVENIYGGENNLVSINIKKGEKVKLFFENNKKDSNEYIIKAIRPIEVLQKENKKLEKKTFNLDELWEANFMLTTPIIIDKNNSPFDIETYL